MHDHHKATIQNVKDHFLADPSVLALLLTGSIAHDFERADSDVDILIVLSDEDYDNLRKSGGRLTWTNTDLCTYAGGYIDGKYTAQAFIRQVSSRGSEPARWAFDGASILFSRIDGLDDLLKSVVAYPTDQKVERIKKFRAQFEGWNWFSSEARKRDNKYLQSLAVSKLALFGTRLILAHNEILYPFHKWMLKVLETAPEKPKGMVTCLERMCESPSAENVRAFYELVTSFREWGEAENGWGSQFMVDVELAWMFGTPSVDDL